jgi:hypothetical protein
LRTVVLDTVVALKLRADCVLQLVDPIDVRVAREAILDGIDTRLLNVHRCVEIRFAGPQSDHVLTFGLEASGAGGDGKRGRGLDALDAS